jgi:hypothetical protein
VLAALRNRLCWVAGAVSSAGAALLAATVTGWGGLPGLRVSATGTGAGSRDTAGATRIHAGARRG